MYAYEEGLPTIRSACTGQRCGLTAFVREQVHGGFSAASVLQTASNAMFYGF